MAHHPPSPAPVSMYSDSRRATMVSDTFDPPEPDALAELPIFPLPNCVLLPGGLLPLHVFEPRYRELTRDCLAGHQFMGIARLRPGFETTYYGRPPVYERFGVGKIICSEELPDGRFALLLRGVARVELARELPSERAYRRVEARVLADARRSETRTRRNERPTTPAKQEERTARRGERSRRPAAARPRAVVR